MHSPSLFLSFSTPSACTLSNKLKRKHIKSDWVFFFYLLCVFCQFQKACVKKRLGFLFAIQFIRHVQGCHKENNIKINSRSSTTSSSVFAKTAAATGSVAVDATVRVIFCISHLFIPLNRMHFFLFHSIPFTFLQYTILLLIFSLFSLSMPFYFEQFFFLLL